MNTIVLDACFIIGLRDCNKTHFLPQVAKLLSWKLILPQAVYSECMAKIDDTVLCEMISNGTIIISQSASETFVKYRNRYHGLGKGEIDALAYAVSHKENNDPIIMITSDQHAIKIANSLGVKTLTMLDFFEYVYKLKLMTTEEMHQFIPTLKQYMWVNEQTLYDFLKRIK